MLASITFAKLPDLSISKGMNINEKIIFPFKIEIDNMVCTTFACRNSCIQHNNIYKPSKNDNY